MTWQEIADAFVGVFTGFSPVYLLETVLIFLLVYYVFKVLKNNDACRLIAVYVVVIVLMGVLCLFVKESGLVIFLLSLLLLSMFMLLLFSLEIKRSIREKKNGAQPGVASAPTWTRPETEACIEAIIKALQNMSKNDIGALVVLSNGNLPKQILESGTMLDADISQQLIEGIFFPKAPLHDGAMIVEGSKIYAAGCFLPLAQSDNLPKEMGSRHRAALGVTSVASVTALVVSEETGIISIVKNGAVKKKYADAADLKNALSDYYWSDLTAEAKE